MKKISEILEESRKRFEQKKTLVKDSKAKPPDHFEWEESRTFINLPDKAKQKILEKDPVEYDRLIKLTDKVWSQWQSWFMGQDKDAEHPFVKGLFIKRWRLPIGEYFKELEMEAMKERIGMGTSNIDKKFEMNQPGKKVF